MQVLQALNINPRTRKVLQSMAITKIPRLLVTLAAGLLSACGSSPIAPTRVALVRAEASFDGGQLGHASVTNTTDKAAVFTFIIWDANDEANQIDKAQFISELVASGQQVEWKEGFQVDPCVKYQRDIYMNLPKAERYTLSDVGNFFYASAGAYWPKGACSTTTTTIPVVMACSADAFSYHEGHVEGNTIIEHMTVKPGYGGIVAYLISWGVPALRINPGDVPLPQVRVAQTVQVLHVGVNVMTAALASASLYAGWQWEWGCEPGPPILTEENLYSFSWIEAGWGNFGGGE